MRKIENILSGSLLGQTEQRAIRNQRKQTYWQRSVSKTEFSGIAERGWRVHNDTLKTKVQLRRDKSKAEQFEDQIWTLFSTAGFREISEDRNLVIKFGDAASDTQQVDVLAVDENVAVVVECKSATLDGKSASFKEAIEALREKKGKINAALRAHFGRKLSVAYVFATEGYRISKPDLERLENANIRHFSENEIGYFLDLIHQLGKAAKFQLLADLFPNIDIPDMDNRVYAIEGKMGGRTYYSFSIAPSELLKISYVLHRSRSIKLMPSYQRVIKKARLKSVKEFVDGGGYFPNSLIINIDNNNKDLQFDVSKNQINESKTRGGVLHLPKRFRSAYIVDGQHRLYGYSDSRFAASNTLPVVAFVNLERGEQLKIFMDINENQKAVSKNLRHTLEADIKWESPIKSEAIQASKLRLAQELGEDQSSPLKSRVLLGEDNKTDSRVITIDAILSGLNRGYFFSKFSKNTLQEKGVFHDGTTIENYERCKDLVFNYFELLESNLPEEWTKLQKDGGLLTINAGITASLAVFGSILSHLSGETQIDPFRDSPETIIKEVRPFAEGIYKFYENLNEEERSRIRSSYGGQQPVRLMREMQRAIKLEINEFEPDGLEKYEKDQTFKYNQKANEFVSKLEIYLRDLIEEKLRIEYGREWEYVAVPEKIQKQYSELATKLKREQEIDMEQSPYTCTTLIHLKEIAGYKDSKNKVNNWKIFEPLLTPKPLSNSREDKKRNWMLRLNSIRNKLAHNRGSVTEDEFELLSSHHKWLVDEEEADLIEYYRSHNLEI